MRHVATIGTPSLSKSIGRLACERQPVKGPDLPFSLEHLQPDTEADIIGPKIAQKSLINTCYK